MKKITSQTVNIILIVAYLILGVTLIFTPYLIMAAPCFLIAAFLLGYYLFYLKKKPTEFAFVDHSDLDDGEGLELVDASDVEEVNQEEPETVTSAQSINIEDTLANLIKRDALLDLERNKERNKTEKNPKNKAEAIVNFASIVLIAIAVLIAVALVFELF